MRTSGRITSAKRYKIFVTSDKGWGGLVGSTQANLNMELEIVESCQKYIFCGNKIIFYLVDANDSCHTAQQ